MVELKENEKVYVLVAESLKRGEKVAEGRVVDLNKENRFSVEFDEGVEGTIFDPGDKVGRYHIEDNTWSRNKEDLE